MSGSEDEDKQHEPTQKRLDDARKKGEVPRSTDLNATAAYSGFILATLAAGAWSVDAFGTAGSVLLGQADRLAPLALADGGASMFAGLAGNIFWAIGPFLVIPAAFVALSIAGQRSLIFAPNKLEPKLSRISPISNAKNKFGPTGLFEFAKSGVKLFLYTLCLTLYLVDKLPDILGAIHLPARMGFAEMVRIGIGFFIVAALVTGVVAVVDYLWQVFDHHRRNRMSHQELKDEFKQSEGDPHAKQKRRQRGMEIAMNQMMKDVPDADVIVVNPTHYAVALKWERTRPGAPVCVAKGVDEVAARIRETASEAGVPIHRDPPTARALHATVEIGQEVPPDHYKAVAAAIRFADRMRAKMRKR